MPKHLDRRGNMPFSKRLRTVVPLLWFFLRYCFLFFFSLVLFREEPQNQIRTCIVSLVRVLFFGHPFATHFVYVVLACRTEGQSVRPVNVSVQLMNTSNAFGPVRFFHNTSVLLKMWSMVAANFSFCLLFGCPIHFEGRYCFF